MLAADHRHLGLVKLYLLVCLVYILQTGPWSSVRIGVRNYRDACKSSIRLDQLVLEAGIRVSSCISKGIRRPLCSVDNADGLSKVVEERVDRCSDAHKLDERHCLPCWWWRICLL
jgi:hypothetical protein